MSALYTRLSAAWQALLTPEPMRVVIEHRVMVLTAPTPAPGIPAALAPPLRASRHNTPATAGLFVAGERRRDGW